MASVSFMYKVLVIIWVMFLWALEERRAFLSGVSACRLPGTPSRVTLPDPESGSMEDHTVWSVFQIFSVRYCLTLNAVFIYCIDVSSRGTSFIYLRPCLAFCIKKIWPQRFESPVHCLDEERRDKWNCEDFYFVADLPIQFIDYS